MRLRCARLVAPSPESSTSGVGSKPLLGVGFRAEGLGVSVWGLGFRV